MPVRSCSYRGCNNRCVNGRPTGKLVFFKFPNEPTRREKWLKFGGVSKQCLQKNMYMCSLHFDKRYISVNSRRTSLVGDSTPYPYNETEVLDEDNIEKPSEQISVICRKEESNLEEKNLENECIEEEGLENFENEQSLININYSVNEEVEDIILDEEYSTIDEQEINSNFAGEDGGSEGYADSSEHKTSTTFYIKDLITTDVENADSEEDKIVNQIRKNRHKLTKKLSSVRNTIENEKQLICYTNTTNKLIKNLNPDMSDDAETLDEMKTFFFRGQEYVQMPKAQYLTEKNRLLQRIEKYELLFQNIQKSINSFK